MARHIKKIILKKRMKKTILLIFLLLAVSCSQEPVTETNRDPIILFCPQDNCMENLVFLIENSDKTDCALFDVGLDKVTDALSRANARVVLDNGNYNPKIKAKYDGKFQLMHNKFCIFNESIVWTGSFNPTVNGNYYNNDNVVILFSKAIAKNYEEEFEELWNGIYGRGRRTENTKIILNNKTIEIYFCPEDWCANKAIKTINNANKSIYFAAFSFTHEKIAEAIINKNKNTNNKTEIKGVMEKSQYSKYSVYDMLKDGGIDVRWDSNPANMHHKFFIIDEKIVITGSFNPTLSGDNRNDENLVIMHDEEIAKLYLEEFDKVYDEKR